MSTLDLLDPLTFSGIRYPYSMLSIKGGLRDHIHEYPHVAGGAPEKLGRRLYEISATLLMESTLITPTYLNRQLWPRDYNGLRALFEDQVTAELNIPGIGKIQAYIRTMDTDLRPTVSRSGVTCEVTWIEDQAEVFGEAVQTTFAGFGDSLQNWKIVIEDLPDPKPDIFDAISDAANGILAFADQFELYGNLLEAKIRGLTALVREADDRLDYLNDPANNEVLEAMLELWGATNKLNEDLQQTGAKLTEYTVPIEMTVGDVAADLYGDSGRGTDIMSLNALENPLAIPGGTVLRVYRDAA